MTKEEALSMLDKAPRSTTKMSRVNPALTENQSVVIVENCLRDKPSGWILHSLFEKRVWQVCKNQKRPRY